MVAKKGDRLAWLPAAVIPKFGLGAGDDAGILEGGRGDQEN